MLSEIRPGTILAGKYEVEHVLGRGGMGLVVAARHLQLHERVAIKFLLPEATTIPEVVARFSREARAAVRIKSEHVARVSDVGTLEGGAPYMVMEYLEGADLSQRLAREGALPIELSVEFLLQASEAIAEAHALGIVHRDLKPANLFVVRRADGILSVKVLDFGISKMTPAGAASDVSLTRTAAVMGSPLYMPPEQMAASRDVDARSDIWALGAILYELLTASAPFAGETLPEVCMRIATEPPPPLARFRPDVPAALEAVILRCLEKDRERRYPNVAELALALGAFAPQRARVSVDRVLRTIQAAGLSSGALSVPPPASANATVPAVTAGTGTEAQWGRTTRRPAGRWGWLLAAGLGTLAALGLLAFAVARTTPTEGAALSGATGIASAVTPPPAPAPPAPTSTVASVASIPAAVPDVVPLAPSASPAASTRVSTSSKRPSTRHAPASSQTEKRAAAAAVTPRETPKPAQKGNVFDER